MKFISLPCPTILASVVNWPSTPFKLGSHADSRGKLSSGALVSQPQIEHRYKFCFTYSSSQSYFSSRFETLFFNLCTKVLCSIY